MFSRLIIDVSIIEIYNNVFMCNRPLEKDRGWAPSQVKRSIFGHPLRAIDQNGAGYCLCSRNCANWWGLVLVQMWTNRDWRPSIVELGTDLQKCYNLFAQNGAKNR